MKYNGKKYSGKDINKIMYQETKEEIEINIKCKIKNLRFGIANNMQYYHVLEVTNIIDYAINNLQNQEIKEKIELNIKYKISKLLFVTFGNTRYYSAFEVYRILDNEINDLERKIFF